MKKTPTCRYHCATCGAHFTSLKAFDAHREGLWSDKRVCVDPDAAEQLVVEHDDGVCTLTTSGERVPAVLYGTTRHAADRQKWLSALPVKPQRASEAPGHPNYQKAA